MNIPSTIEDNIYEDPSCGSYGIFIFRLFLGICLLGYFICIGIILLFREAPSFTEDYMGMTGGIIFLFGMFLWLCSNIRFASQTIQKIGFDENSLFIRLYFLRKRFFDISDLKSVEDFKVTRLMSQIETFPENGTGFFIEFKNGKKYRVSPNMQNFETLKHKLLEIMKKGAAV